MTLPRSWYVAPHMLVMGNAIDTVRLGECKRLRITMPPRHAKTETCTLRAVVRWLLDHPDQNVLVTGYNQRYANRLSRKIRELARRMGVRIKRGAASVNEWETDAGGCVVARGVGSPPTGIGFNLIVIDDPVRDSKQVESEHRRELINDWYLTDIYQRLEPGGAIILVMTQWHEFDLATVAIESEPKAWVSLVLPAEARENDPLGRAPGEALWPERFDKARLEEIRAVMSSKDGPRMFDALFNCNPYPKEGLILRRTDFKIIERHQVPAGIRLYRAYDVAMSESEEADETVGTLGGKVKEDIYLIDQVAWKLDILDSFPEMLKVAETDGADVVIGIERPLAGHTILRMFQRAVLAANLVVKKLEVRGRDKKIRMSSWGYKGRSGNLYLVRGAWNEPFIKQCLAFNGKTGGKDDKVDSVSNLMELIALSAGKTNGEKDRPAEYSADYWRNFFGDI